jgi:ribosomal protein S14
MKKRILIDNKNRYCLKKNEIKSLSAKIILRSKKIKYVENMKNISESKTNFTKIRNMCYITYRTKSVFRLVKLSRIKFKELCSYGFILGVKKRTW